MVSESVRKKLLKTVVFVLVTLFVCAYWAAITILVLFCWGGAEMYFTNAVRLTNVDCFIAVLLAKPIVLNHVGTLIKKWEKAKGGSNV